MMVTDGEVFYHRTEQAGRSAIRVQSRPRVEEPAPAAPMEQRVQQPEPPGRDRLLRLEHLAQQLDRRLAELDGAMKRLAERYIGLSEAPAVSPPAAQASATSTVPAPGPKVSEGANTATDNSVKVALFADGTARAILGQVRIEHQVEPEPTT